MTPLATDVVGDTKDGLLVALTAVAVVLLVACVNVAGLALARGSARDRELGIRAALGAGRGRLVRQLTTEGLVLFVFGGGVGLTLAAWVLTTLAARLPDTLPRVAEVGVDWRFLVFGAVLTTLSGVMFSVLPAVSIARQGTALEPTASRGTVSVGRRTQRVRGLLIVAQVAAAIVLLTAAGLAVRSLGEVSRAETGFERAGAMTFNFVLRDNRFPTAPDMRAFTTRVWESIEAVPGVLAAGITTALPLSGQNVENAFTVDGSPTPPEDGSPIAGLRGVSGHYAAALGTRVLRGRDILPSDTADSPPVVLVTADFVARYVRQAVPIGVRLKMRGADEPWRTIVGVIPAIRHNALDELPRPEVWLPFAQMPADFVTQWARGAYVVARTTPEPESVMPAIRSQIRLLDAELPLMAVTSLDGLLRQSTSERRLETSLLTAFASIALVLAAVGLFGVLAFYVAQHVPEFGVRLALGATPAALLALVLRRGIVLLVGGVAIGLPGALAMGRGMSRLLYGVEPTDPAALVAAVTILAAVTLAACALPALRAMKTDPLTALRSE
jgi:predicted permease